MIARPTSVGVAFARHVAFGIVALLASNPGKEFPPALSLSLRELGITRSLSFFDGFVSPSFKIKSFCCLTPTHHYNGPLTWRQNWDFHMDLGAFDYFVYREWSLKGQEFYHASNEPGRTRSKSGTVSHGAWSKRKKDERFCCHHRIPPSLLPVSLACRRSAAACPHFSSEIC